MIYRYLLSHPKIISHLLHIHFHPVQYISLALLLDLALNFPLLHAFNSSSQFYQPMQHLLRLLNLSLKQSSQKDTPTLSPFKGTHPHRFPRDSDSPEYTASQRLNYSLQHQRSQRRDKSTIRVKGISQSQRIESDFQGKNNSIRISKHTYRINHNPYVKSEAKMVEQDNSSHPIAAQIIKSAQKKMATIEIGAEFQENTNIFSRKKKNGDIKRQNRVQASPKQRNSGDSNKMKHKKSKMLKLVGVGCKIFQANPILWRKPNEASPFQSKEA